MKEERRDYYVYAFLRSKDSTTGPKYSPYYVGKGTTHRAFSGKRAGARPPKDKSFIVFIQEGLTEQESLSLERYCIALYGRADLGTGILRNLTDGGEGVSGLVFSDESRRRLSESHMGIRHSEETKLKMSKSRSGPGNPNYGKRGMPSNFKGKRHTEESKRKISEAKKGRKQSDEEKRMRSKAAHRYTYEVISPEGKVFIIKNLAAFAREHDMQQYSLAAVARGTQKQHKGWKVKIIERPR
jgi:hypothetical protein